MKKFDSDKISIIICIVAVIGAIIFSIIYNKKEQEDEAKNKAINTLLKNPSLMQKMGQKGRKLVEDRFNYKLFCDELAGYIKQFEK